MNRIFVPILGAATVLSGGAMAQPASSISPLSPIYFCAEKTDPAERLACFDGAVAAVKAAEARSEIVALDQPRVAAVRREAFGFRIPSLPRFGLGAPAAQEATVPNAGASTATTSAQSRAAPAQAREQAEEAQTFAVARVGRSGDRVSIFLENGNVWHLTEAVELNAPRQTPFNVRIRNAAMGTYMLTVEGRNKGYRVRRVE